jgi:hypothetical protein
VSKYGCGVGDVPDIINGHGQGHSVTLRSGVAKFNQFIKKKHIQLQNRHILVMTTSA